MSSAAKLRIGRATAVVASAAIVMTSFGPAAFAWQDVEATAANTAGAASIGLVDTDRTEAGTQGATAIVAGANSQDVADIRMVVPATYGTGDFIELELGTNSDPAQRVLWSATPNLTIDGPYATETHVGADSGTTENVGETEENGALEAFTAETGETVPAKPNVTPTLVTDEFGAHKIRLTFNSQSDASQANAKFVFTLTGLKVNVGSAREAGNVEVSAQAYNAAGSTATTTPTFWGDTTDNQNVTIPAYVTEVGLSADTSSLTSDDTVQQLGPVTVAATPGLTFDANSTVQFTASGDYTLAASPNAQVTWYNAANQPITGSPVAATVDPAAGTVTATAAPTGAVRAVFSGVMVDTTNDSGTLTLTLTQTGGRATPPATLTTANVNQTDITAPDALAVDVAGLPVTSRLGGIDRYETAVKMAQRFADANPFGEQDNLVIASGEQFPDALSSGYLARTKGAPVVLTRAGGLPDIVKEYIRNRGVKNVFIVGGTSAISEDVENELKNTDAFDLTSATDQVAMDAKLQVVRIAGDNRYETNRAVNEYAAARTTQPVGTTVPAYGSAGRKTAIVVNGTTPWDALASGPMIAGSQNPAAGVGDLPIVLTTPGAEVGTTAARQFQTMDITHAIFVGGYTVLPQSMEADAAKYGTTSGRLGGENRWQTAEAVGNFLLRDGAVTATGANPGFEFAGTDAAPDPVNPFLTNGGYPRANAWADALASGPVAARETSILALTTKDSLPADTRDLLTQNAAKLDPVIAVGLGEAVSTEAVNQANAAVAD